MNDAFYVGYQPSAPASIQRSVRRIVAGLAALTAAIAAVLIVGQHPFALSRFEFGVFRPYEGELLEWPYPMVVTSSGKYLLVGAGKFGVAEQVHGHDGDHVQLNGSLIERGPDKMLEVEPGSVHFSTANSPSHHHAIDLGPLTVTGEIVDTKCHLGVMNPGEGKVHRDCAVRCISGGAPPAVLVRDSEGETRLLLLTGSDGRPLGKEILDYVAEPITISGQLVRQGTSLILKAEPHNFRRE